MTRGDLDAFVAHHRLSPAGVDAALELARARPSGEESRRFLIQLLRLAGVLSLAAGVVFFVAANWQDFHIVGRFALVQAVLVTCVGLAIWGPAPAPIGRYSTLLAFIASGALLALFGQTYQTGADVYELFLTWAVLGVPLALAGQWSVTWAAWLLVLNTALALFCMNRPAGGWLWLAFGRWNLSFVELMLIPTLANTLLWGLRESLQYTRWSALAPPWLGRLACFAGAAFGTTAGAVAIVDSFERTSVLAILVLVALAIGAAVYAMRRREDVFPVAVLVGSFIVLSTCALAEHLGFEDLGLLFVMALWVIVASTLGGRWLMHLVRDWRREIAA